MKQSLPGSDYSELFLQKIILEVPSYQTCSRIYACLYIVT